MWGSTYNGAYCTGNAAFGMVGNNQYDQCGRWCELRCPGTGQSERAQGRRGVDCGEREGALQEIGRWRGHGASSLSSHEPPLQLCT
jgi:hypothetical protein